MGVTKWEGDNKKKCYPPSHVSEQNVTLVLSNIITAYIHEA